jgi:hypothetical protein
MTALTTMQSMAMRRSGADDRADDDAEHGDEEKWRR